MNVQVRPAQTDLARSGFLALDAAREANLAAPPGAPGGAAPSSGVTSARLLLLDAQARARHEGDVAGSGEASGGSPRAAFEERFAALAGDPAAFHALLREVYGDGYDAQAAEALRGRALEGDFDWLPEVRFVGEEVLGGANGAYDADSDTVYIAERLKGTDLAAETFVEEAGHALDVRLNGAADTAGDEGELFRRLLGGEALSAEDKAAIRAEDDTGTITVDGELRQVEFWGFLKKAVRWVKKEVIDPVVNFVDEKIIEPVSQLLPAPIREHIVDPLRRFGRTAIDMAWNGIETAVDIGSSLTEGTFRVGFELLRGNPGGAWEAAVDTGRTVLQESVGYFVENGTMALHAGVGLANGLFGLSEVRSLDEVLTPAQRVYLERIYGDSIDYDSIRVQTGGIEEWVGMDPHAVTNDIYLPDSAFDANGNLVDIELLSHELAHSWQFQNGGAGYLSEAIASYIGSGDPYDWRAALDAGLDFDDMTPDQQAEFARVIGIAIDRDPAGGGAFTRSEMERTVGRSLSDDEWAYVQDIRARLLAGDA